MNKKILIGSIIAVAILVLVSFTGVVGYQTTKSSTIAKASPLFTVRSSRAIDEESKDLSCNYVGKGEEIAISVPTYNSRNTQLQKVIDVISRMDDERFNRLVESAIGRLHKGNKNVYEMLQFVRDNPSKAKNLAVGGESDFPTMYYFCTVDGRWQPTCLILGILNAIADILFWLMLLIIWIIVPPTIGPSLYCCPLG